ncbi:VOC family protein [Microlunatus soli]|uniref:VOC domain-containing protein n=1 Tax=Microlunatus soli TaxID=630515 RepID=A0A1H1ZPQ0_9ACTN|nr:VOC family protein [Microlunatus soli]SDT35392.1 hypothetical protein SAMN04489812_5350 [Microlunatus soli]
MANGLFAGIPVRDFRAALAWYVRLLGAEPSFYPNDIEAVWQLAENQFVYIVQQPERAGGAVNMIWADDLADRVAALAARGLEPTEIERLDGVSKYVYRDPDGNETGLGGTT